MPATKVFAGMARSYTPKLLSFLTHVGISVFFTCIYPGLLGGNTGKDGTGLSKNPFCRKLFATV
jgi:hypothetical protein